MSLTRIKLDHFTAFKELDLKFSPGINVFVGANGTGKTHLMKVCYAACDVSRTEVNFPEKLIRVFLPSRSALGRLVRRQRGRARGSVEVFRGRLSLKTSFSTNYRRTSLAQIRGEKAWNNSPIKAVYIPVKEMLSNAPGFLSLYAQRDIHFEEIYNDILIQAYQPALRGPMDTQRKHLLTRLRNEINGTVRVINEEFVLSNSRGNLEFTLLAEGMRKLGLLWILIQNGTLQEGSILFWDEPETNLNPRLFRVVIEILLNLQRNGVQVFLATHDYVILKELDLQQKNEDKIAFHAFHQETSTGDVKCHSTHRYLDVHPNAIADTFDDLYDREVSRSLEGVLS